MNAWDRLALELPLKAEALVHAYQAFLLDAAKQLAPVASMETSGYVGGDLRNSGTLVGGDDAFSAGVAFTVEYARYQEFGTMDMPAQPFLRPARDALRGTFRRDIAKLVKL